MSSTFGNSTQEESEWSSNKEMNIQENSSVTDSIADINDTGGDSSWRPTDEDTEDSATENPTGAAGQSPAEEKETGDPGRTPGKAEGEDFSE